MTGRQQLIAWVLVAVATVIGLYFTRDILLPFVAGFAVAYFLDPVVDRLEERKLPRWLATSIVLSLFFVAVIGIALMLVPVLHAQFIGFAARLPGYLDNLRNWLIPLLDRLGQQVGMNIAADVKTALPDAAKSLVSIGGRILMQAWTSGLALFNLLSLVVISPIVAFYLLRDWDHITARVDGWLPREYEPALKTIFRDIDEVLAGFVRGQGTVCLILAAYYGLGLSLAGLEFGLVIGIFSGLVSFIPFVGATFGLALSLLTAVTQFWPDYIQIAIVAVVFIIGQVLEGHFLTPRLLGDRVGLHPVWVIFALMAGGVLLGFVGVLIAVPSAAVIGVLARFFLGNYLRSRLFLGDGARARAETAQDTASRDADEAGAAVGAENATDGQDKAAL